MADTEKRAPLDAIGAAPIAPPLQPDYDKDASAFYSKLVAELQVENADLKTRLAEAEGRTDVDAIRARMMEPWANKVFFFVCIYCSVLFGLVLLAGFKVCNFQLSDTVLAVLAGGTAVSVIGLIGIVVGGLFGGKAPTL